MSKFKDISGQKFGRLTTLHRLHNYHKKGTYWLCVCECGNLTEIYLGSLQRGTTTSCGCYHKEIVTKLATKYKNHNVRMYRIWNNLRDKCYNENNKAYKYYGKRGIKICDKWLNSFDIFYDWAMANGYDDNLTIDRIDNNKGYSPNNCRWTTMKQQNRNKRSNRNYTINGETHCLKEWCEILGLKYNTIIGRINQYGWSIERALELEGKP